MKKAYLIRSMMLIALLGLVIPNINAQELATLTKPNNYANPKQPSGKALINVIRDLEKAYKIRFNYNTELISGKTIDSVTVRAIGNEETALEELLDQLLLPLDLRYEKLKQGHYVIYESSSWRNSVNQFKADEKSASSPQKLAATKPVEQQISGTVKDGESGEVLPGVNVLAKGTTSGTVTDIDGAYRLSVADDVTSLVFSSIGYVTEEVAINGRTTIDLEMMPDIQSLSEVVVIGYGTQKKSDLTGAVSTVKGETLQERPSATLNQALSGRMTGVNVSTNSGRPGGKTNIRIRGNTSVSVANDPLYVVDGVILVASGLANSSSPIDYLNPNDIASIEVLKDASATAIYGARGANGVIMVTTKRGNKNGGEVSYNNYFSLGTLPKKIPLLNSEEFLMVEDIAYQNAEKYDPVGFAAGKYQDPALKRTDPRLFDENGDPIYDTDWQDEVTQKAFSQSHQLSFTGGNEKGSYGAFLGYVNEEGLMRESWLKRYSARFVFDTQIREWFKVGGSLSYNNQNERHVQGVWVGRNMVENLPIVPVKYPDGSWGGNSDYPGMEGGPNPVRVGEEYENYLKTNTVLGNVFTNITLAEGLDLRTTVGVNNIEQRISTYGGRELSFISSNQKGDASLTTDQHVSWQLENYLTYTKEIEDHTFTGLLGVSWQHIDRFSFNARTQNFTDDYYSFNNLGAGSVVVAPNSNAYGYGLNSYFGRINYGLLDKYLVTVTGRMDGSSKFGEANRYAFFPSAALAWRVSEEEFIKNIPAIYNLKLRTSYGVTGNSEIAAYQALAGMQNYNYIFGGSLNTGTGINRLANPSLQWEKTKQIDAGVELGLFNGRLSLEADVYRKLTTDMLLQSPVPASSGYTTVTKNIGSMVNKGVEFAIHTINVENNDFSWSTNFNISINKNEVTALSGGSDIFNGANIIRVGEPVSTFFGLVHVGTWNTDEESTAAQYNRLPGDVKYLDINEDGKINQADRAILGKGIPDGFGTFSNTFKYKNFDLLIDLQFQYGNEVLWRAQHSLEDRQGIANSFASVLDAWTPDNQDTRIAQIRPIAAGYDTNDDASKIYDGSFIRGRNILLGYNFSPEITDRLRLKRLRVYGSVQNFFLSTEFPGYDPESQTSGHTFGQGYISYNEYPKPRVFMIGLNASF
ncbi:TonB-linked SusC/RagA family outer membrane protein [Catalinimonas alkaloidigena]|uniref:SusC/RagA family TonB-linked outer membrane protein n=1 Tax=Catalinimonas alkaloidigena TaxID=1075417 RepID=UPI0024076689|nr:TonB-dependent receptor [Catalinimonas alkaloidigena]MDF9798888.1 TonB-linked SusC/RagA family outer membrane protein [Catalinimonas alkaloidigena]